MYTYIFVDLAYLSATPG